MLVFFVFLYRFYMCIFFFFSSRRRHTRWPRDWSSDVCSSDLLFGDYIYTSGAGVGTKGFPAVAIEADPSLSDTTALSSAAVQGVPGRRTFYRRYIHTADAAGC